MKKLLFIIAAAAIGCNEDPALKSEAARTDSVSVAPYIYKASYADKFEKGDDKHSRTVLEIWKAYDNNQLDSARKYFADTVYMKSRDGYEMYGTADSILKETKQYRSGIEKVVSEVAAFTPLKATANGDNWVSIWGKEFTTTNGKLDSIDLHEIWRFNKDGKVDWMRQYASSYMKK